MRHKKHHLPVIALAIVLLLLALVVYFAVFFRGGMNLSGDDTGIPEMYAPQSGSGAATGGL